MITNKIKIQSFCYIKILIHLMAHAKSIAFHNPLIFLDKAKDAHRCLDQIKGSKTLQYSLLQK